MEGVEQAMPAAAEPVFMEALPSAGIVPGTAGVPLSPGGHDNLHINNKFYLVEKVLEQRVRGGEEEVLVKWVGYRASANSWEPAGNINPYFLDAFRAHAEETGTEKGASSPASAKQTRLAIAAKYLPPPRPRKLCESATAWKGKRHRAVNASQLGEPCASADRQLPCSNTSNAHVGGTSSDDAQCLGIDQGMQEGVVDVESMESVHVGGTSSDDARCLGIDQGTQEGVVDVESMKSVHVECTSSARGKRKKTASWKRKKTVVGKRTKLVQDKCTSSFDVELASSSGDVQLMSSFDVQIASSSDDVQLTSSSDDVQPKCKKIAQGNLNSTVDGNLNNTVRCKHKRNAGGKRNVSAKRNAGVKRNAGGKRNVSAKRSSSSAAHTQDSASERVIKRLVAAKKKPVPTPLSFTHLLELVPAESNSPSLSLTGAEALLATARSFARTHRVKGGGVVASLSSALAQTQEEKAQDNARTSLAIASYKQRAETAEQQLSQLPLSDATNECTVCFNPPKTHVLVPCGHLCVCSDCAARIVNDSRECPQCRSLVTHTYKVFL